MKNIGYKIVLCSKLLKNKLNRELEVLGITASQFAVIKDIEINSLDNKIVTAVAIGERLDMDKPTISAIIKRLISKGYVKKEAHPTDKRSCILLLTKECIDKLSIFEESNKNVIVSAISDINNEKLNLFENVLDDMISNLKGEA